MAIATSGLTTSGTKILVQPAQPPEYGDYEPPTNVIPAYELINGNWYYNPDNTGKIANFNNFPVNPSKTTTTKTTTPTSTINQAGGVGSVPYGPPAPEPTTSTLKTSGTPTTATRTIAVKTEPTRIIPAYELVNGEFVYNPDNTAGVTNFNKLPVNPSKVSLVQQGADLQKVESALKDLKPYEVEPGLYNINQYMIDSKSPGTALQTLRNAGFSQEAIKQAAKENLEAANLATKEAQKPIAVKLAKSVWQGMTPWDESKGETATAGGIGIMAAEIIVPGVYTVRHWDEMSGGERAFSIAMDAVQLIPFIGAAAKGAKSVSVAGRGARIAAAAKAVGKEAGYQLMAPIDMVIHPISTVKGAYRSGREFVENVVNIKKIPEAVITTSDSTVRLRVNEATSPAQAMAIRDDLMRLAAEGKRPMIQVGDNIVELGVSPLMKEVGGGVVHTTPQGTAFVNGLEVLPKKDLTGNLMPLSEQGLFVANQPLPRFAEASAFGKTGDMPAIVIFGKDTAAKAVPSGKIYSSPLGKVSEMELKFPIGAELPAPKQKLFTRIGPLGQRVEIFLDKPLNAGQVLKLKGLGIVEDLKAPFKPAINIAGADNISPITRTDADNIIDTLYRTGNVDQARALERAQRIVATQRVLPPTLERVTGRVRASEVKRARGEVQVEAEPSRREITRPDEGPFDERRVYDPYAEPDEIRARREAERAPERRAEELRREPARREELRREAPRREELRRQEPRREDIRREDVRREEPRREEPRREEPRREAPRREEPRPPRTPREEPRTPRARVEIPRETPARTRPPKEPPPRIKLPGTKGEVPPPRTFPKGSVAWKQGIGWWVFKPPYTGTDDRVFVLKRPQGATIAADAKSAIGTIQSVGGTAPIAQKFDMGITDVYLKDPPVKPSREKGRSAIRFRRDTDKSYGGKGTKSQKLGPYYYKGGAVSRKPLD